MQYIRWTNSFQFYSIDYQKAGFIVKQKGSWNLTPEGEAILKKTPEEVMNIANEAYHEWRRLNPKDDSSEEEPTDDNAEGDRAEELNMLPLKRISFLGNNELITLLIPQTLSPSPPPATRHTIAASAIVSCGSENRHHIMWSIGNEVNKQWGEEGRF